MLTKSSRTKFGARPAANCSQSAALASILYRPLRIDNIYRVHGATHEATLFVVFASSGSLMMTPLSNKLMFSE